MEKNYRKIELLVIDEMGRESRSVDHGIGWKKIALKIMNNGDVDCEVGIERVSDGIKISTLSHPLTENENTDDIKSQKKVRILRDIIALPLDIRREIMSFGYLTDDDVEHIEDNGMDAWLIYKRESKKHQSISPLEIHCAGVDADFAKAQIEQQVDLPLWECTTEE